MGRTAAAGAVLGTWLVLAVAAAFQCLLLSTPSQAGGLTPSCGVCGQWSAQGCPPSSSSSSSFLAVPSYHLFAHATRTTTGPKQHQSATMSKRNRSAWDEAMGLAGAAATQTKKKSGKRTSGRTTVLSKAMGKVDEETRREVRDARLEALEADNYVENAEEEPDEAYVDSEVRLGGERGRDRGPVGGWGRT